MIYRFNDDRNVMIHGSHIVFASSLLMHSSLLASNSNITRNVWTRNIWTKYIDLQTPLMKSSDSGFLTITNSRNVLFDSPLNECTIPPEAQIKLSMEFFLEK